MFMIPSPERTSLLLSPRVVSLRALRAAPTLAFTRLLVFLIIGRWKNLLRKCDTIANGTSQAENRAGRGEEFYGVVPNCNV